MEYTKELKYNHQNMRYMSVFSRKNKLILIFLIAALPALLTLAAIILFKNREANAVNITIFWSAAVLSAAALVFCLRYLLYRRRYKFNVLIDDQHVFARFGAGYIMFDKYEIGTVMIMPRVCEREAVSGTGDKNFVVTNKELSFYHGAKRAKIRAADTRHLAYVLYNLALYPDSAVNWGVAYLSK